MKLTTAEVEQYKHRADADVSAIERDGSYVARNACQWDKADNGATCVQALGHSMNAVRLPKGQSLTYSFHCEREGDALLRLALIPTQPADTGDLRFSVSIDGGEPHVFSLKEPFRSERWKQNVLRQQAVRELHVAISKGYHTLIIKALDHHIILDQWMLDHIPTRRFYMFPISPVYPL